MGSTHSIALVSRDGEEVLISADVLSAASVVWRERLQLLNTLSPTPRSDEACSADDIRSFVQVISMLSQDAKGESLFEDLPIQSMLQALPLIHKYDCPTAKKILEAHLEKNAFPRKAIAMRSILHQTKPQVDGFFTQQHVDYIIKKQELYGPSSLTTEMKQALVGLLYYPEIYPANFAGHNPRGMAPTPTTLKVVKYLTDPRLETSADSFHVFANRMKVNWRVNVASTGSQSPSAFVIEAWRFTAETQHELLKYIQPNF